VRFRIEPSPAGGYLVRLEGHDVPVSRHDTEEEAEEWVARHAGGSETAAAPGPRRVAFRPHFVGLDDGTQVLLRPPRAGDGERARDAILVAVDPPSGDVVGALGEQGAWAAPAWEARGLAPLLRLDA
jgi:hypothetical protein